MKPAFIRPITLALITAFLAVSLPASEPASRRRAVGTVDPRAVILIGTITDAATGVPIFDARVSVGSRWGRAQRNGTFRISRGLATGGASATIERWGYETETRNVALVQGTNTLNVTMKSKPVLMLTTRSGEVHRLDYENSIFTDVYPFRGLSAISPVELCAVGGSKSSVEKKDLKVITFTAQKVSNGNCCASPMTGYVANITLKSGERFDAMLANSCTAYNMGFSGGNHDTGDLTNYPLSQISKIEFP